MPERFVSEPIDPVTETSDTSRMAIGEPGLPRQFVWRGRVVEITRVLRSWRRTGPCRHGSGEQYVRRHWFRVRTRSGAVMTLYFDKGSHGKRKEMGWFLYAVQFEDSPPRERS